jgi:putative intracellular protease/amidase
MRIDTSVRSDTGSIKSSIKSTTSVNTRHVQISQESSLPLPAASILTNCFVCVIMTQFTVAVYLYPGADILDFSGPTEIYSSGPFDSVGPFKITSFAHHNPIETESGAMTYVPNGTFKELESRLEEFDVLVIPGAKFHTIEALIKSQEGKDLSALLRQFARSKPRQESGKRVLHSVCTGSVLLAASGILAGTYVPHM